MHARRLSLGLCLVLASRPAPAQTPEAEATHYVVVLDNGSLDAPPAAAGAFAGRIPWWSGTVGADAIKRLHAKHGDVSEGRREARDLAMPVQPGAEARR